MRLLFAGLNRPPQGLCFVVPGFSAVQRRPSLRGLACRRPSPAPCLFFFGGRADCLLVQRCRARRGSAVSPEGQVVGVHASASHIVSLMNRSGYFWRLKSQGSRMRRDRQCTARAAHAAPHAAERKPPANEKRELTHCLPSKVYASPGGTARKNIRRGSILQS
jgi:hypothetical protein